MVMISSKWAPNPGLVAANFDIAAAELERMQVPLRLSVAAFIEGIDRKFAEQPWAPLSPMYAERRGSSEPILEVTGEMHSGLASEGSFLVTAHELFFTGEAAPERWHYHQHGYTNQKASVPARPMVDMDAETEAEILAIWDQWVAGIIGGSFTGGSGVTQIRGPGGRFGRRVGRIL